MHDSYRVVTIQNVLTQVPTISVVVVGLYVSWIHRKRHPRVAGLTTGGLGHLLVASIGLRILPNLFARREATNVEDVLWTMFVNAVVANNLTAAGVGLLLWAAFGWRGTPHLSRAGASSSDRNSTLRK
jgi:hypothetical protein